MLLKALFTEMNVFRMVMIALTSSVFIAAYNGTSEFIIHIIFMFTWILVSAKMIGDIVDDVKIRMKD